LTDTHVKSIKDFFYKPVKMDYCCCFISNVILEWDVLVIFDKCILHIYCIVDIT